jgi:hypothetical protein
LREFGDVGENGGSQCRIFITAGHVPIEDPPINIVLAEILSFLCLYQTKMLGPPLISVLGRDPNRLHNINANSFQQNVVTTVNGWQFAAFYSDARTDDSVGGCYVNLARRQIPILGGAGDWHYLTFEDYKQIADDGHNGINIGVCKGDGTVHVAFDHHCDQ